MKQKEEICGNCIFLKGTFCKYFGEYREPQQKHKEHDCFEPHERGGNCYDIISELEDDKTDYLAMFTSLPHLDDNKKKVDDWGYTPNLYHFDTKWYVSWIHCSEGDSLVDFMGDTPEEAIAKAYDYISELKQ